MKKNFSNIAKVVREGREKTIQRYSQSELSHLMGYRNGQFVSNIERGVCSVPFKKIPILVHHLNLDPEVVKAALLEDLAQTIDGVFAKKGVSNVESCQP